ncbi:MAG: DUF1353 domain-containing protein, partial [Pseudomonadota bacterium]|nr:DUF1353 domain-containing protein [Pseudomonadota bacterium]
MKRAVTLIAVLALSGCASVTTPETSLHVAVERDAHREGFRRVAVITDDYFWCYPLTHEVIRVPRGFETDFASIPYAVSGIIDPMGDNMEAAVIHDYLYAVGEPGQREKADTILLDALEQHHVDPIRRKLMYETVRMGGAKNYGAPTEWRFADPETQRPIKAPPKPK